MQIRILAIASCINVKTGCVKLSHQPTSSLISSGVRELSCNTTKQYAGWPPRTRSRAHLVMDPVENIMSRWSDLSREASRLLLASRDLANGYRIFADMFCNSNLGRHVQTRRETVCRGNFS